MQARTNSLAEHRASSAVLAAAPLTPVRKGSPALTCHIIRSVEELDDLSQSWIQLASTSKGTPFQSFAWNRAWYRAFADEYDEMLVFTFSRGLGAAAIIPLYRKGRTLRFAADRICDQQDAIAADPDAVREGLREIMKWARDCRCHLKLLQVSERGWIHEAARTLGLLSNRALRFRRCYSPCPYVDLPESGEAFLQRMPRKLRGDMRRHLNKLDREHPDARLEIHRAGDLPGGLVDRVAEFHASNFRKNGVSLLADRRFRKLVAEAAQAPDSGIRVSTLRDGDELMAVDVSFTFHNTYHGFLTAFDENHRSLSPGTCMLLKRLDWFIENDGVKTLDFLLGAERYKYQFAQSQYNVCAFYLYPWSLVNTVRWAFEIARHTAKWGAKKVLAKAGLYKPAH